MGIKHNMVGAFDKLEDEEMKKVILEVQGLYNVRNGKKNNDGSIGEIKITPQEFLDLFATITGQKDE